jgi:hypothetical protein
MARKIKKELYYGGIEDKLSNLGHLILFIGIMGLFLGVLCVVIEAGQSPKTGGWQVFVLIVFAFISFVVGIFMFILLQAIAEMIKLLKKENKILYSGVISQPLKKKIVLCCSNCGMPIKKMRVFYSKCIYCGEPFEAENE